MTRRFNLDEGVAHKFCELNTVNANVFLNKWEADRPGSGNLSASAVGFIARGLLRNRATNEDPAYNPGLKWWKDDKAVRDFDLRRAFSNSGIRTVSPSGRPAPRRPAHSPGRTRWPVHGRPRKTPEELLAILDRARNDYDFGRRLRPDLYKDLIGTAGRLNRDPGNTDFREPVIFAKPGPAPAYPEFRAGTSYLNVAKLCYLDSLCPGFHDIYRETLCGRIGEATINKMVGAELDKLIEMAEKDFVITKRDVSAHGTAAILHLCA